MSSEICILCQNNSLEPDPVQYLYQGKAYTLNQCQDCGLFAILPRPSAEEVKRFYTQEYFEKDYSCGVKGESYYQEEERALKKAGEALGLIKKYKASGQLLEVGCAGGLFLREAHKAGFEVTGLELSEEMSQKAREKLGLPVLTGDFATCELGTLKFDVICMFDVFEHFAEPVLILERVASLLNPGGMVLIDIPTTKNALPYKLSRLVLRRLKRVRHICSPPYHLFEYSPKTLERLAGAAGLRTHAALKYSTPPWRYENGSVRGFAKLLLGTARLANYGLSSVSGHYSDRLILLAGRSRAQ